MGKGKLLFFHRRVRNLWTKLLWKSQCKTFKSIGPGSSVASLPYIQGSERIEIGDRFYCGNDVRIEAWTGYEGQRYTPEIRIGNDVVMTDRSYLSCINRIEIGDGALIGRDVFISDNGHGDTSARMLKMPPLKRPLASRGPVMIGKNVWIGRQVTILSGVTIGDGAVIGANSVVTKSIPAYCVACGSPAKVIRKVSDGEAGRENG